MERCCDRISYLNKSGHLCVLPSAQTGIGDGTTASDFVASATVAVEDAIDCLGKPRDARMSRSKR